MAYTAYEQAELLKRLQEKKEAEQQESERKQSFAPEAFDNMMQDIEEVVPREALSSDMLQEESKVKRDIANVNQDSKSDNQKTSEERKQDSIEEIRKYQGQYEKDQADKEYASIDPKRRYMELIKQYEDRLNKKDEGPSWGEALPDVLAGLYNIGVQAKGRRLPLMKTGSLDAAAKRKQAKRKEDLSGLENLQKMYKNYMGMQTKKKGLTEGQQALDKAFAKDYSDFAAQGGIASLDKNIGKLKDVQKMLKDGDYNLTGAGLGMVPDFIRNITHEKSIAARDSVESVIQQSLRQILGAQFTEKEAERLIQRSYNESLTEEENAKRLGQTIKELEAMGKAKEKAARYFEKKGTLAGFKADLPSQESSKDSMVEAKVKALMDRNPGLSKERAIKALKSKGLI